MIDFAVHSQIFTTDTFQSFAETMAFTADDLIFTHRFLYDDYMAPLNLPCATIFCEEYGQSEPNDAMVNALLKTVRATPHTRFFGIGGGTVLDISKILCVDNAQTIEDVYDETIPLKRTVDFVLVPTTCGTGAEMTCVSVVDFPKKDAKIGKRIPCCFADQVVLIPTLLEKLPYTAFLNSSVDALIHAMEIYLAPDVSEFSKVYCEKAIELIVSNYQVLAKEGPDARLSRLDTFSRASCYAGVALSNTVCGAVHACAMQFGSVHHVPHGAANYLFFMGIFRAYAQKNPNGTILDITQVLNRVMGLNGTTQEAFSSLSDLLLQVVGPCHLGAYIKDKSKIQWYVEKVYETQQRLLIHNYVPLSQEEMVDIWEALY